MEQRIQKNDFVILTYSEQVRGTLNYKSITYKVVFAGFQLKIFKTEAKMAEDLRKEVERLKQQIKTIESVQSVLAATTVEAEKMLKIEKDPVRLCTWVAALKRLVCRKTKILFTTPTT